MPSLLWLWKKYKEVLQVLLIVALLLTIRPAEANSPKSDESSEQSSLAEKSQDEQVKSFNEVLQDLINEFSFDLRAKALNTLRSVAIRRVALGEGIPRSYEMYLETQISDAFRKHSGTKVLQCTNCRIRRTVIENGRLVMTTPINNPQELDAIASQLGVDAWVDLTLIYQETNMILSFHVFDAKSKELLWSKLYNTENIYKQKMEQKEQAKTPDHEAKTEKKSKYSLSTTLGWQLLPNVKQSANMLAVNVRFVERFHLGRHEVGTRLSGILAPSLIISDYPEIAGDPAASAEIVDGATTEVVLPFSKAIGLFAMYGYLFHDSPDTADSAVFGMEFGGGTIASTGYACFAFRLGSTLRLGERFTLDAGVSYSLPTSISIRNRYKYKTPGGIGADVAFGLQF